MAVDRSGDEIARSGGTFNLVTMSDETLLLVDGSSYLFRAFHALPDLRNKQGEPTGAIHGIVGMLRRLREDERLHGGARYGAVVFDAPGRTFRDDWYAHYKATRTETPTDLQAQIPAIHEISRALGWPLLIVPGIEADDVIATLAERARGAGMRTIVSTSDKDLAQLVDDRTLLVNTMTRDGSPPEPLDRDGVVARFGVPPERIIDLLTLTGDSVDNIPGVDKVGPKTAAKWVNQYGDLDGVIAHAGSIGGKVGENLRAALEWLPEGRRLVTVRRDCDLTAHIAEGFEDLAMRDEDTPALRRLFDRWELRTYARRLGADSPPAGGATDASGPMPGATAALAAGARGRPRAPVQHGGIRIADRTLGTDGADVDLQADADAAAAAAPREPEPEKVYELVTTVAALDAWVERIAAADLVAFDCETDSLDPVRARIVGIALAVEPYHACYIPVAHRYPGVPDQLERGYVLERLRPWIESESRAKVGQHSKYDRHVLANHGISLGGLAHDTLLESYVLEAHRTHNLDSLAARHLDRRTLTYEEVAGRGAKQLTFDQVDLERATRYSAEDAEVTVHLHRHLYPQIAADPKLERVYRQIEMPTERVLFGMERHGVLVDTGRLERQSAELASSMHALELEAHQLAGQPFNVGSPKQLGDLLFGTLKLPVVKKTASGAPSTDEEVLEKLAEDFPLPRAILRWRALAKLKSTYCDKLPQMVSPRTGRVHTTYGQAVAVTGRLSSTDPNLQNIPIRTAEGRRIREAFIAAPGNVVLSADYSQIELRIMAHISEDAGLLGAFADGIDVHRATAAEVFGVPLADVSSEQRRYAKVINFGLIYGMSAFGLAANLGIERDAARSYIERYFARYPGVAAYMERTRSLARDQGYVETVFGRRLWLAEIRSPNGPRRAAAERAAINAPMQGTAADLIKLAMIDIWDWLIGQGLGSRLIMQVHDELVFEVPAAEVDRMRIEIPRRMASVAALKVPLVAEVGVGANWDEAH
jgi:DNA polymerase-1